MKIRIYSDIHLDSYLNWDDVWYPPFRADDKETTLLLCGDLWVGANFISNNDGVSWIQALSRRFKQVLVVLGNHDYWSCKDYLTIVGGGKKCNERLAQLGITNVKVLDCDVHQDGDVLFVGCTLWTDLNKEDPLTVFNLQTFMKEADMTAVFDEDDKAWSRYSPDKWLRTHYRHRQYLKMIIEQNRDKKIVVMTHHVPAYELNDPHFASRVGPWASRNGYYLSDLTDLIMDNPHVKYWFYGHVHYQNVMQIGETTCINNCVGYMGQFFEKQKKVNHITLEI